MLLIKGGHVIDPSCGLDGMYDVLTAEGKIAAIAKELNEDDYPGIRVINAKGMVVAPGLVDVHSHFREPGFTDRETISSGAAAAAAGGYTSIVCMANTEPAVDNVRTLNYIKARFEEEEIHLYQDAAVTVGRAGEKLVDMGMLKKAGAVGFTDDGTAITDGRIVADAMKEAGLLKMPLSFHEEDPEYVHDAGINAGEEAKKLGLEGASREAEIEMVKRDLKMALKTGAVIDIQHVSAAETVDLIRKAKKKDASHIIHAEATPHHFSLTEDAIEEYGTNAKVNPPLRTEADRKAIIEGIQDGTLDLIATDHAPHTAEEKARLFKKAPSGMIGLETALALGITKLVKPGYINMMTLIRAMSTAPAELYMLPAGTIRKGKAADIVIFSPSEVQIISKFRSKAVNSPFIGSTLIGKVHYTIVSGKIVYSGREGI